MAVEVHVVTPEREVWAGDADSVIAHGVDGEVGILTGHAPMMVQLAIGPLRILREGEPELRAVVDGGFMHVTSAAADASSAADAGAAGGSSGTRVDVLASSAELADDIDFEAARARAAELEEQLSQKRDTDRAEAEVAAIEAERTKALARINVAG